MPLVKSARFVAVWLCDWHADGLA